jgi:hypothetical protein
MKRICTGNCCCLSSNRLCFNKKEENKAKTDIVAQNNAAVSVKTTQVKQSHFFRLYG